jgi:nitroreductase
MLRTNLQYKPDMDDDLLSLIAGRHCTRAFLKRPVPLDIIEAILSAAASAPSSQNNQPWQVAVIMGKSRDELSAILCESFDQGVPPTPDYLNRPQELPEALQQRVQDYGRNFLTFRGIARDDEAGRHAHRRDNFLFYGAPVELIFHLPATAAAGTFLDLGFFMQNVILGFELCGLASCPQYSVASYSDILRRYLGIGSDRIMISGMAVGYPDQAARLNRFIPERVPLEAYTQWYT